MSDREFEEAKLLYNLITKSPHPIDDDQISNIIPLLGFSSSVNDLQARLERLMQGMPTEDEFIAMAVWMEKCKLAHKLEQEQSPMSSSEIYQVPDILAVFDHNGHEIPFLIEVKTSHENFVDAKLRFSERLHMKLVNYANLVGLPMLIAWKAGGYWTLFDIREMKQHESAYHIDWPDAMKADLMFLLLDSVTVIAKPGVSFTFVLEDLGTTGRKTPDGEEHHFKFHSLRFLDTNGNPVTKMSWPQFVLWTFADHAEKQEWRDNLLELVFEIPQEPIGLPSYLLLPLMVFGWRSEEKRPKNWYDVIREEDFGPISYSQFKQAMNEGIGTFVRYVMQVVPHNRPDFLPAE